MRNSEPIALRRDCEAVQIPAGTTMILQAGTEVRITQALGDSFTVVTDEVWMVRISNKDGDALRLEAKAKAEMAPEDAAKLTADEVEAMVWEHLKTVYDPEIPVDVVELGLVYTCQITKMEGGHRVFIQMTLTAPGCGMGPVLANDAKQKILSVPTVKDVDIEIVFEPQWDQSRMSEAARLQLGM